MNTILDNSFSNLNPNSKVWVFYSSTPFDIAIENDIEENLNFFIENWKTHGSTIHAEFKIIYNQIVLLVADETNVKVSGCAIDSVIRHINSIEQKYNLSFFDRNLIYYIEENKLKKSTFQDFASKHQLNSTIQIFNPYFTNLEDLKMNLVTDIKDSKLYSLIKREMIKINPNF